MQSILDQAHTWFLESIHYANELSIRLVEGKRRGEPTSLKVGDSEIGGVYPLESDESSRRVVVYFVNPVAWQTVDESFTAWDESEERDGKAFLQILTKSKYLDYVDRAHGWYKDVLGGACHYRLWTENEVMDVVAPKPPRVEWTQPADC